jgi:hypothetical protein
MYIYMVKVAWDTARSSVDTANVPEELALRGKS